MEPCRITTFAIGIITILAGFILTACLFPSIGYISFTCTPFCFSIGLVLMLKATYRNLILGPKLENNVSEQIEEVVITFNHMDFQDIKPSLKEYAKSKSSLLYKKVYVMPLEATRHSLFQNDSWYLNSNHFQELQSEKKFNETAIIFVSKSEEYDYWLSRYGLDYNHFNKDASQLDDSSKNSFTTFLEEGGHFYVISKKNAAYEAINLITSKTD